MQFSERLRLLRPVITAGFVVLPANPVEVMVVLSFIHRQLHARPMRDSPLKHTGQVSTCWHKDSDWLTGMSLTPAFADEFQIVYYEHWKLSFAIRRPIWRNVAKEGLAVRGDCLLCDIALSNGLKFQHRHDRPGCDITAAPEGWD